ncbi:hypothetical protein [Microbulbifer sp. MCCC 1A16149]
MSERRLPSYPSAVSTFSRIFCLPSQTIWLSHMPESELGFVFP